MKRVGSLLTWIFVSCNVVCTFLLLLSAYSPYLPPAHFPLFASMGLAFPIFVIINLFFLLFWMALMRFHLFISLAGLLICIPQLKTTCPLHGKKDFGETELSAEGGIIKLLSYNVMGFNELKKEDGENPILNYMKESRADIICMQEFNATTNRKYLTKKDINAALKDYPYRSIRQDSPGVVCYSKYRILSSRKISYESQSNSSVAYRIKYGSDTLLIINNHLESNKLTHEDKKIYEEIIAGTEAHRAKQGFRQLFKKLSEAAVIRAIQADTIAAKVHQWLPKYKHLIVCGDFNDSPISYTHRTIKQELSDGFSESGRGLGISYNQHKFWFRIDHILVSPSLQTHNCTVDHSIEDSDHYPIWCYISPKE